MTTIDKSAPVLVTGASGYLAGWIVKELLEDGLTVHATVRDPAKKSSTDHLKAIAEQAPGELQLFKADLLEPGSFDEAMSGCELVIHTASPYVLTGISDPQKELVDPAVSGTENVLESVNASATVRRVVLTSSVAAMYGDVVDFAKSGSPAITEADWNTTSSLDHQPYSYSKVQAEKKAWEMNKAQDSWDLVTINPAGIWGPSLTANTKSASVDLLVQLGDGRAKFGVPSIVIGFVDVRDVAHAHVLAGFNPAAAGRYLVADRVISFLEMGQLLQRSFGDQYPFPTRTLPKKLVWIGAPQAGLTRDFVSKNVGYDLSLDHSKAAKDLNLTYRTSKETLTDHYQQLIDDGIV